MPENARYGLIADVHANIDALRVVLDELAKENVQEVFCLGDLVGYNATPREVLNEALKMGLPSINGNHDRYVTGYSPLDPSIKRDTAHIIEWTRENISKAQMTYLESLSRQKVVDGRLLMVHGSPRHEDEYILSLNQYKENIQFVTDNFVGIEVTFFGHTHVPVVVARGTLVTNIHKDKIVKLDSDKMYLVNPGSVGQPRDGCPLASFAIYDQKESTVTIRRVEYDIPAAQEKVLAAGFDARMAKRLELGK